MSSCKTIALIKYNTGDYKSSLKCYTYLLGKESTNIICRIQPKPLKAFHDVKRKGDLRSDHDQTKTIA